MIPTHILVLGASKSGTTLLATSLGCHTDICMLDEDMRGTFSRIVGNKIKGVKLCLPNQVELTRKWNPIYSIGRTNGFFRKSLFMNKIPRSPISLRDYKEEFRNLKIVGIIRDPDDVIASLKARAHRSGRVAAYRWTRCIEILYELQPSNKDNLVLVHFDNFVTRPRETLRNICARLEIPFQEQMLDGAKYCFRYPEHLEFDASKAGNRGEAVYESEIFRNNPELKHKFQILNSIAL